MPYKPPHFQPPKTFFISGAIFLEAVLNFAISRIPANPPETFFISGKIFLEVTIRSNNVVANEGDEPTL